MYTRKYEITMTELWKITANSQVNFTITTEQNDFFGVRTWNNSLAEIFLSFSGRKTKGEFPLYYIYRSNCFWQRLVEIILEEGCEKNL